MLNMQEKLKECGIIVYYSYYVLINTYFIKMKVIMKILFLHLSDLHIQKNNDGNIFHSKKIVDSLNVLGHFDYAIIIISGDIAYSGSKNQYQQAWYWVSDLFINLQNRFHLKSKPIVLVVPGNHDVDLSLGDLGHGKIQELFRTNLMENQLATEYKKLQNFFNYSRGNSCCFKDPMYSQRLLVFEDFKIEANLLNSALFSTRDEEKGLHFFSPHIIEKLIEPTNADFVITVMHHSYHWFNENIKKQLEHVLLSKNSLIFFGHEHNLDALNISDCNGNSAHILAGGVLCKCGDWTTSEYYASVLDSCSLGYTLFGFKWDIEEKMYIHNNIIRSTTLPSKPSREKRLIPTANYLNTFFVDPHHNLAKDFSEYYVFPRLLKEEVNEKGLFNDITNENDLLNDLSEKKKIIISGHINAGKTALLKQLFKILSKSKVVLFCNTENISGNCKRLIKETFEGIYGTKEEDYIRFEQIPKEEKVLIIDDIDRIRVKDFNLFIEELEKNFEYIIYSTNKIMEFNLIERLKKVVMDDGSYQRYRILTFYSDKMQELILKIVKIKSPYDDTEKIAEILSSSLKKQRSLYNLDPEFIIQYTEFYYDHFKDAIQGDGLIFGKVFESNISNALKPYTTKKLSIDKIFIILDKIAYFIHSNKANAYPLKQMDLVKVIQEYNNKYARDKIDEIDFIQIVVNARILVQCGDGNQYKFRDRNQLAYFIAREIRRKYQMDHDNTDLYKIMEYSCFGINADILLFMTYITDDLNMLRDILDASRILTDDWKEFDFKNIPYLSNMNQLDVSAPDKDNRQEEEESVIEQERHRDNNRLDTIDIYDYKEQDIENLFYQLARAVSLLCIIARCLPNFEHMMEIPDKDLFVNSIYHLPYKIFFIWANEIEKNKDEVLEFLRNLPENDYFHEKKPSDEEILKLLQWDSISMLLDLINMSVLYSAKENSEVYFESFDYKSSITYSLVHLKVIGELGRIKDFITEVNKISDSEKSIMAQIMVKRIVRHILTHSKIISREDIQKLQDKFFNDQNAQKRLLIERAKNIQ